MFKISNPWTDIKELRETIASQKLLMESQTSANQALNVLLEEEKQYTKERSRQIEEPRNAIFELRNRRVTIEMVSYGFKISFLPNQSEYRRLINCKLLDFSGAGETVVIETSGSDPVEWLRIVEDYNKKYNAMDEQLKKLKEYQSILNSDLVSSKR
jgi:predicted P-loop ATPase/GTPase